MKNRKQQKRNICTTALGATSQTDGGLLYLRHQELQLSRGLSYDLKP
jgi:hypothetical protein